MPASFSLLAAAALMPSVVPEQQADARSLMAANQIEAAEALLNGRTAANQRDVEAHFLLGMIASRRGVHSAAVTHFRRALAFAPDEVRIRLELARALFSSGNYQAAYRHFQLARAGNLPAPVRANVNQFLAAIRDAKDWSYAFDLALAPDSNINGGSSARETLIFGLPFTLGDDARRQSGTGIDVSGTVEYAPRLGEGRRFRLGGTLKRRDYKGSAFDDQTFEAYVGPRFVTGKWDVSVLGTAASRTYGDEPYQRSFGLVIEATHYLSDRTALNAVAMAKRLRHTSIPGQDGILLVGHGSLVRALTTSSSASAGLDLVRHAARAPSLSYVGGAFGAGYRRELGNGLGVEVRPLVSYLRYSAPDPLFGARRVDFGKEVSVSLTHQRYTMWRFSPRVTYRFARRSSTIDLYDTSQNRFEFGLTTDF